MINLRAYWRVYLINLVIRAAQVQLQVINNTKDELSNIVNKNKEAIQLNSKEILNKLLYGEDLKIP